MYSKEFIENRGNPPRPNMSGKRHKLKRPDPRARVAVNIWRLNRLEAAGCYDMCRRFIERHGDPREALDNANDE